MTVSKLSFNSLFEMREAAQRAEAGAPVEALSILYLRCHSAAALRRAARPRSSFNSLFEMQRLG